MADTKILVVDDEMQMRTAVSEALTRCGYSVTAFSDPQKAADAAEDGQFAMVITDVRMPGLSGLDLLRRIKKNDSSLPVVVMTAFGTIQDAVEAMKIGAFDYLLKPFSLEDIEAVVIKALKQKKHGAAMLSSQEERGSGSMSREFVTENPAMERILSFAKEIAGSSSTVLIQGESGTGKELVARMIHASSSRAGNSFIAVNCAAIPEGLLESELFGHEKGSFSGAMARKIGKFERANGGTLLLDEIGEMDLSLQAKLLRVLQEEEVERVGGQGPVPVDARILATTNRNLREEVGHGKFREDLFYRLNVVPLMIPPLRERRSDIRLLSDFFLKRYTRRNGKKISRISAAAVSYLEACSFPGNVRELENMIERAVLLCKADVLDKEDFHRLDPVLYGIGVSAAAEKKISVRDMEQDLILETLRKVYGNRTQAASMLGISIRTLRNKLADYRKTGITVPPYDPAGGKGRKKAALKSTDG